ncbi:hypothetical protein [Acinetobacter baumannii]|uniref:hypothetical protein n=1 Tax=Acinetobacter baumannii TaxID=470 RepID=UPI00165FA94D|nr:hypothetical protein [Acinetobacter baumannii]MBD0164592.1 hypothetical protein [Acinetobacter baumannii]MBD0171590.1 hypothetical protein [Acinetobacter baumannii]MBP4632641.1 hypothetical protein [Acinetobacter baumannii]MBP4706221.1 hypothetical protein [Acinetobacter baumannii]HBM1779378.1 hypothetical protein [Acinetobacter baumannii]
MNNADPQLEHVDPAHPVAPDAYIRVLNCKSNYVNILAGWFLKDGEKKFYIAEGLCCTNLSVKAFSAI